MLTSAGLEAGTAWKETVNQLQQDMNNELTGFPQHG
jgi:hypothetical protein